MSHHGTTPFDKDSDQEKILNSLFEQLKSGDIDEEYSKEYPAGKINETDEGILAFRITHENDRIIIDFGKSVYWLGLRVKEAKGLIKLLEKHINEIEPKLPKKNQ